MSSTLICQSVRCQSDYVCCLENPRNPDSAGHMKNFTFEGRCRLLESFLGLSTGLQWLKIRNTVWPVTEFGYQLRHRWGHWMFFHRGSQQCCYATRNGSAVSETLGKAGDVPISAACSASALQYHNYGSQWGFQKTPADHIVDRIPNHPSRQYPCCLLAHCCSLPVIHNKFLSWILSMVIVSWLSLGLWWLRPEGKRT